MPPAQSFEDLNVWQKAHRLVLIVYAVTARFPAEERYGLAAQMRRAAVSVAANIAEGFKRRGRADKARMMNVAQASLEELRYYVILARDLQYSQSPESWSELDEVGRMLNAYTRTLLSRRDDG